MEQHIIMANGLVRDLLKNRNMRAILVCLFVLLVSQFTYSQIDDKVSDGIFKLNILTPGFTYECSLNKNTTLNFDVGLSLDLVANEGQLQLITSPFVRSQYRFYYNIDKRLRKGKSILGNSAGFIAPSISYYTKPIGDNIHVSGFDGVTFGGVWGFQKTYKSNLNLCANAGLGYNFSNNVNSEVVPILNLTIAWVFLK